MMPSPIPLHLVVLARELLYIVSGVSKHSLTFPPERSRTDSILLNLNYDPSRNRIKFSFWLASLVPNTLRCVFAGS